MPHTRRQIPFLDALVLILILTQGGSLAYADISQKQVRKLIAHVAGATFPSSDVRIQKVNMSGPDVAEATAELELVFRLEQNENAAWQIREIRTGQDQWEDLGLIAEAAKFRLPNHNCGSTVDAASPGSELTVKRARCLIADLFGVSLPSDEVRIKELSTLSMPIGSRASALVVALVQSDFRLRKGAGGWRLTEFQTGSRSWLSLEGVQTDIDRIKRTRAADELEVIARALHAYRKNRGSFIVSDKHPVLIDHLSPSYLSKVIRLDPWHRPYQYEGGPDRFVLRSLGPDGKLNTPDDVVISEVSH